ncbi:MAG: C4-dicarboxylate ABC transporter, partial [Boseongicola sp.]|nr:C4-dicarboxylate ABC transporter [Boseongicola sp.]
MTDATNKTAEDMVAEVDTGGRDAGPFAKRLIFALCIIWSLFQLYIASKVPGVLAQITGIGDLANIVAQARYVHLAFALSLATLAFPMFGHRHRIPVYDWILLILGVASCLYLVIFRFEIADRPGLWTTTDIVVSGIGMCVLMVAVFRSLGLPLVIIASAFLALTFFGGYSEWVGSVTNYGG